MPPRKIRTVLKELLKEKDLSQLELSKRSGVAQGYISALVAGEKQNPSVAVMRKLAKALGVPVSDLLG
jgi:transcriptional regulator with XRE-family HTH domain